MTTADDTLIALPAPELGVESPVVAEPDLYSDGGYVAVYEDLGEFTRFLAPDWEVLSEADADAIMSRIGNWEDEKVKRKETYEAAIRRLDSKIDWFQRRYGPNLQDFAARALAGKKVQTLTLPCGGKLYFRNTPAAVQVIDNAVYQDWVGNYLPDAITFVPQIDKKMVNDFVFKAKQVPPGLAIRPEERRFYFK